MVAYAKREAPEQPYLTPQEYLERERKAETKSEYSGGVVVAMAGASKRHNRITANISGELHGQLKGEPCQAFVSDLRVGVPECNRYYYPDVAVVCGEPIFVDAELDTLLNPTLIVEVLSDSTEARDRGEKLECYQALESLQTYVLVAQDRPYIEIYSRQDRDWRYSKAKEMTDRVALDAIGCELSLAEAYARVEFPQVQDKTETS